MIGIVAVIDVADITRSEVGRLWMPLTLVATAVTASSRRDAAEWRLVAGSLAIASLTLAMYWTP